MTADDTGAEADDAHAADAREGLLADHAGYRRLFADEGLTVGTSFPLTGRTETAPPAGEELELAARAESLGFDALWARDVPTYWPKFGEAGQVYDTWPWLAGVAARTETIALGTAAVVLPLRHPLHVAKAAASVDRLSAGRLVLGVATGDRPPEFDAFGIEEEERGARFREAVGLLRTLWGESFPEAETRWGTLDGTLDLVPKPAAGTLPLIPTGRSRQSMEWLGRHGDGWLFYHLPRDTLRSFLEDWRAVAGEKPFAMALRAELADDPGADPEHVNQGFRAGAEWFVEYLRDLESIGVDHALVSVGGEGEPGRALDRFAADVIEEL